MPKRRYEVIRYKVKEPRVQVLNPLTQRWVYKPYSTAYYSHQCTNDPAPNHNAINEAPGANHEESRSKSRQRLAKEVAMIFNAAYGAAQGRSAPLPFPYKRHKAKPVVEVMGLPANQNVPGVLRYPRLYGLHYLKQLVAGKTAIAMKLINKDSPPAVSPPPTVAAPPPPPTVAAPPPPPTVALPPPQEKGLPLSIEMLTVPALKSDNVDTEVEAEEIEMSEAAAVIALEKIRQLLGVQKQEGLAVLGVAPAKAAVKKVYKRHPLSVEEKAALQETFSSGELPSRAVLERCMASHDLLKKRQFKQCYNYLHKKKLKANRLLPRK